MIRRVVDFLAALIVCASSALVAYKIGSSHLQRIQSVRAGCWSQPCPVQTMNTWKRTGERIIVAALSTMVLSTLVLAATQLAAIGQ
jgi:hypothetical protein